MIQIGLNTEKSQKGDNSVLHQQGCRVCGTELIYTEENTEHNCYLCGQSVLSNVSCPQGHFICDECHRADAMKLMQQVTHNTEQNPVELARQLMKMPVFNMHGPEHHLLVPVVLLTALKNLGVTIEESKIKTALLRAAQLPGGICGSWGGCGAVLGAGIALSVFRGSSPLKREEWGQTNRNVGEMLIEIGNQGGPRCCKRTTYTALLKAIEILEKEDGIRFPQEAKTLPTCTDFHRNSQCLLKKCPYFPKKSSLKNEEGLDFKIKSI